MQYYCIQHSTSLERMSETVKRPVSKYRKEQAAATRARIAEAAQRLFARDGYGSTSTTAIATEAGVGDRTVFAVFGNKRDILNDICERWLERAGARELAQSTLAEPDSRQRLRGAAHWLTVLYSTDFDVVRILDAARDEDADTRSLIRSKLRGRNGIMDRLIESVSDDLMVPLRQAQSIFRAYAAGGVYEALVVDGQWSAAQFDEWLAATLEWQLMAGVAQETR